KLIEGTGRAEVIGAVATIDEAREALAGSPVDVVFVDVQLAATGDARTGLDLVRSLAGEPLAPMFVLATASSQHSLEAFDLGRALFRVHRNWLVNLAYVKELDRDIGGATVTVGTDFAAPGKSISVPVSQDRAKALRDVLLENATGLRRT